MTGVAQAKPISYLKPNSKPMAIANQVNKRVRMDVWRIVKYQILTYCFLNDVSVSDADLDLLTLLAIEGEQDLTQFCSKASERKIFKSPQSARNALIKIDAKGLVKKQGKTNKRLSLSPEIDVQSRGNVMLDYKFLALEAA